MFLYRDVRRAPTSFTSSFPSCWKDARPNSPANAGSEPREDTDANDHDRPSHKNRRTLARQHSSRQEWDGARCAITCNPIPRIREDLPGTSVLRDACLDGAHLRDLPRVAL